jgi:hypothetical protein
MPAAEHHYIASLFQPVECEGIFYGNKSFGIVQCFGKVMKQVLAHPFFGGYHHILFADNIEDKAFPVFFFQAEMIFGKGDGEHEIVKFVAHKNK